MPKKPIDKVTNELMLMNLNFVREVLQGLNKLNRQEQIKSLDLAAQYLVVGCQHFEKGKTKLQKYRDPLHYAYAKMDILRIIIDDMIADLEQKVRLHFRFMKDEFYILEDIVRTFLETGKRHKPQIDLNE